MPYGKVQSCAAERADPLIFLEQVLGCYNTLDFICPRIALYSVDSDKGQVDGVFVGFVVVIADVNGVRRDRAQIVLRAVPIDRAGLGPPVRAQQVNHCQGHGRIPPRRFGIIVAPRSVFVKSTKSPGRAAFSP